MNSQSNVSFQALQALPDGEAELPLVVHLRWEDLAALGREASRLAVRLQRPVSLDEAAGHHLRTRFGVTHAPEKDEQPKADATRAVAAPAAAVPSGAAPMAITPGTAQHSSGAHAAPPVVTGTGTGTSTGAAPAAHQPHQPHQTDHAGRVGPLGGRNMVVQPGTTAG